MRNTILSGCATALVLVTASLVPAQDNVELVSTNKIWDEPPLALGTDLIRFQDQWFVAYTDRADASQNGVVRVIASADGTNWESVALLKSTTPKRGVSRPTFTVSPAGQLMVAGVGVVPNPFAAEPVPKYGGTLNTLAWFSDDGRNWGKLRRIGLDDYPFSRVVWHNDTAFSYSHGCICGSAQTVQFFSSATGRRFNGLFEQTFSGFFPGDAALQFTGDTAVCLMSRNNGRPDAGGWQQGYLGTSRAPYSDWEWKEIDARIGYPNLVRLPDQRLIAAVGINDDRAKTSLCELDPATGKLTELMEVPDTKTAMPVGLVVHDGLVWVSYHAADRQLGVYLAQVSVK